MVALTVRREERRVVEEALKDPWWEVDDHWPFFDSRETKSNLGPVASGGSLQITGH